MAQIESNQTQFEKYIVLILAGSTEHLLLYDDKLSEKNAEN